MERCGVKDPLKDIQIIFGKVNPEWATKEKPCFLLTALSLSSGQIAVLRGVAFKKE